MPSLLDARRTAAALVAVALSAALIAFAFIVSDSFTTQLTAAARASVGDADVVVLPQRGEDLPESTAQNSAAASGVAGVRPYISRSTRSSTGTAPATSTSSSWTRRARARTSPRGACPPRPARSPSRAPSRRRRA